MPRDITPATGRNCEHTLAKTILRIGSNDATDGAVYFVGLPEDIAAAVVQQPTLVAICRAAAAGIDISKFAQAVEESLQVRGVPSDKRWTIHDTGR